TGLPGSGKSTIAQELERELNAREIKIQVLRLDAFRKVIVPHPKYTETERDIVYNTLVLIAKLLTQNGVNIVIDATGNRRRWREYAREQHEIFYEVYIKCPLETCMAREAGRTDNLVIRDLYKNALERRHKGETSTEGLGQMVGVDVPYEEPEAPELIIESDKVDPQEVAIIIIQNLIK
ncbi:MAG: adenylyl-sulfate kinase, partial [Thermoplasmata archaeon]|nr:adenylyl-sulfate kinase [Thermoplasmata archaeon]